MERKDKDFLSDKIETSSLSVRIQNILKRDDIVYYSELLKLGKSELLKHKDFGEKSMEELERHLLERGLKMETSQNKNAAVAVKKSKIYTGGGDKGMTSLVGGVRVSKTHLRIEAYGTVDELNAFIGLLITEITDPAVWKILRFIQKKLFVVGACLATDSKEPALKSESITVDDILNLEDFIDLTDAKLPQLHTFVIPGGCFPATLAHVCRTVCRRAERAIFRLAEKEYVDENIFVFINRISDLLFVISRKENIERYGEEIFFNSEIK
jgi:cob(I)alamin adenosyltransferase